MKKSKKSSKIAESTIFNLNFEPLLMPTVSVSKTHHIEANLEHILSEKKARKNGTFGEKVEKLKKSLFDPQKKIFLEHFSEFFLMKLRF